MSTTLLAKVFSVFFFCSLEGKVIPYTGIVICIYTLPENFGQIVNNKDYSLESHLQARQLDITFRDIYSNLPIFPITIIMQCYRI